MGGPLSFTATGWSMASQDATTAAAIGVQTTYNNLATMGSALANITVNVLKTVASVQNAVQTGISAILGVIQQGVASGPR